MQDFSPYLPLLSRTPLFAGIGEEELEELLGCFRAAPRAYAKGELILLAGYDNRDIGIVLSGRVEAFKTTPGGDPVSMAIQGPGGIFGDVLSGSHVKSPVTVRAVQDTRVLFLPYDRVIAPCGQGHRAHSQLLRNLVGAISDKYFALNRRVDLLILRSLRQRIARFLLDAAAQAGADSFLLPYDREGLAAYLNCNRTALSRELSRMAAQGLIAYRKNSVTLPDPAALEACLRG